MVDVISSGSTGNSVLYFNSILIDVGVPFNKIRPYLDNLKLVLLTHIHGDHLNNKTLRRIILEKPTIRIGCCEWMKSILEVPFGFNNIDTYEIGKIYDYGKFQISPFKLYHDVPNCGYRLFKDNTKIFHATDTKTLEGISAINYDYYCIEANYSEPIALKMIAEAEAKGEFTHVKGSINSHLSEEQANDFFYKNKKENSKLIRLHETKTYL